MHWKEMKVFLDKKDISKSRLSTLQGDRAAIATEKPTPKQSKTHERWAVQTVATLHAKWHYNYSKSGCGESYNYGLRREGGQGEMLEVHESCGKWENNSSGWILVRIKEDKLAGEEVVNIVGEVA